MWLVIFAGTNFHKQAKIRPLRSVNLGPAGYPLCECLELFRKRYGNLSALFQRGEESSLIPRMFIEMIASALGTAVWFVCLCLHSTSISWIASGMAVKGALTDTVLLVAI